MALWQIDFFILPKNKVIQNPDKIKLDDEDYFDDSFFWQNSSYSLEEFEIISNTLAKNKSWSKSIILYGIEDSNCINILLDNNENIESISLRIDFTSDYQSVLLALTSFFKEKELLLVSGDLSQVFQDSIDAITYVQNSNQIHTYKKLSSN